MLKIRGAELRGTKGSSGGKHVFSLAVALVLALLGMKEALAFSATYWTLDGPLPPVLSFDSTTATVTGSPLASDTGIYFEIFSSHSAIGTRSTVWLFDFTSTNPAVGTLGTPFSFQVNGPSASTFTASGLPSGLSINSSTGLISGTPTAAGAFTVTVGFSKTIETGTDTFTLTISR
jgi:Putative Ig domain